MFIISDIKSTIGNYKDNRFNGLFETAAEILVHRSDFLHVLKTVGKPNRKLQAVEADLNSKEIVTMLMALGLIYMKITGPYWNLITSGDIAYLELYPHIQKLHKYLENICERPELLAVTDDLPWHVEEFSCNVEERFYQQMKSTETNNTLLLKAIQTMAM
ncbi:hypothetical protein DPMN_168573 [Dreissena polymorpha]|uniref:Uncharacterized protein n=1 Tax=Dreissena polymorpha TaxID=45954 RepID=A0A9D4F0W7_DREPO|nr:hypothetical protein DPMN_168573 [Dreissena polymorpha]